MAITRKNSIYSKVKNKNDIIVQIITALMLIFSIIVYYFTKSKDVTMVVVVICFFCIPFLRKNKSVYNYKMNINKIVSNELLKLNNKYVIYNDILIDEDGNNINQLVLSEFGIFCIQTEESYTKDASNSMLNLLKDKGLDDSKVYPIIVREEDKSKEIKESDNIAVIEPRKILGFINSKKEKVIDKNNIKIIEDAIKNN
ncbi:MAG: hypothetical protein PHX70_03060 [Clostridium sp.]|nr:hypothetical protein [Clostridium sp.]